ncbi:MAG TPA: DUF2637 domain-containing protein, partial [Microbacterium sp.]|nr:DUF2637 domain-containing protein [Microbacterium sp.]
TAVAGTVFIASGAFWLSFTALADLASRSGVGAGQAWAWPLSVDGIIVVATVAVVALAGHRTAWYPWALLIGGALVSVTANAIHAVVAADADVPGVLAAAVAAVPPVVLLAITHLTVVLTRSTDLSQTPAGPHTEPLELHVGTVASSVGAATRALPFVADETELSQLHDTAPPTDGRRERARELRAAEWSNKRIARELGVHPSTVGRWFTDDDSSPGRDPRAQETTDDDAKEMP